MPEQGYEVEIIDVSKIPSTKKERVGRFDYLFTIRLPNGKIHFLTYPAEELNIKDLDAVKKVISHLVKEELGAMLQLFGKKIKIEIP